MKKILLGLMCSTSLFAANKDPDCDTANKAAKPTVSPAFVKLTDKMKTQELEELAKKNKDKVIQYMLEPTKVSCSTVSYTFPDLTMKPDDSVYFHIPPEFRDRSVRFMVLGHRQEPGPDQPEAGKWDDVPGLTSVQVHSKDGWNYWNGPASGKNGAKFAEIRPTAEIENLYDWDTYGHINMSTGQSSTEGLLTDAMKVTSVGKDKVLLSELTLKVAPPKEVTKDDTIYSEGTKFTPENPHKKYVLSGGQAFGGKFPGAKEVRGANQLNIPIKGKKITTIEIACGDSHPDGVTNSDGGSGTQGWAKLSVGIKKPNGEIKWLMSRENVPPEGVLMTSPTDCNDTIEEGSTVVIKSDNDTTYVMGVHIGYAK